MKKTKPAPKILSHAHTGKLRPHRHTSYASLAIVLVLTFIPLLSLSRSIASAAVSPSEGVGGNYQTYAVVTGPVPTVAPTIAAPVAGRTFTTSEPVQVQGSCPVNTLVKIFKNEVLAGAAACQGGAYQLNIVLFVGNNSLVARAYNTNDAASPDSTVTNLQLNLPGSAINGGVQLNATGAPAGQFFISSELFHRGYNVGTAMKWPIILGGGQAPYAVSVDWGDGESNVYSRGDASRFEISHTYKKAAPNGNYPIIIKATDQQGSTTYLQLVAIVSDAAAAPSAISNITGSASGSAALKLAWQLLGVAVIVVLSFWLGERRELSLVKRRTAKTV